MPAPPEARRGSPRPAPASRSGPRDELDVVFVENVYDPDPTDEQYETTVVYLIRDHGCLRIETDHWTMGLFSLDTWRRILHDTGLEVHEGRYSAGEDESKPCSRGEDEMKAKGRAAGNMHDCEGHHRRVRHAGPPGRPARPSQDGFRLYTRGVRTTGEVVAGRTRTELRPGAPPRSTRKPLIEVLDTSTNERFTFTSSFGSSTTRIQIGEQVPVRYVPGDHDLAEIDRLAPMWFFPVGVLFFSGALLGAGTD